MQNFRGTFINKHRDAWVEVNLGNLEHNILEIKKQILKDGKNPKLLAVIKADAYGHGSVMCAPVLLACGISAFGVASVDEALELRQNKITAPILVLGSVPIWAYETAIKNDIAVSIFSDEHLEAARLISERLGGQKLKAHIKIDTGMNRIGISPKLAIDFFNRAKSAKYLDLEGIFTHFADVESDIITKKQIENFKKAINSVNTKDITVHCSNSAAALYLDDMKFDMVRLGIILYGLTPLSYGIEPKFQLPDLKQVIGLKGRITNIHTVNEGEGVSYGHIFIADKKTRVATIPIGYADGVSRCLSGKIKASLNGKIIKQIGRITMDQMMFDIGDIEASNGDIITLLGDDEAGNFFSIDKWAQELNTINYELTCRLKVRLPRIYVR